MEDVLVMELQEVDVILPYLLVHKYIFNIIA